MVQQAAATPFIRLGNFRPVLLLLAFEGEGDWKQNDYKRGSFVQKRKCLRVHILQLGSEPSMPDPMAQIVLFSIFAAQI